MKQGDGRRNSAEPNTFLLSTYTSHHLKISGITFYTEEFRIHDQCSSQTNEGQGGCTSESLVKSDQFLSTISSLPDTQNRDPYDDANEEDEEKVPSLSSEPIMFAAMTSQQEVRIKMKQVENLPGPKVELEMTFGSLYMLITPRQLHLINYLVNVMLFATPQKQNQTQQQSKDPKDLNQGNTMQSQERDVKLDAEFFHQKFSAMSGVIGLNQGWGGTGGTGLEGGLETLDEQFYQESEYTARTDAYDGEISESVMSSNSSMNSSMTSGNTSHSSKSRRRVIDTDSNADISHFKLRIACVAVVLLHDDILVECLPNHRDPPISIASVSKLKQKAEHFFDALHSVTGVALGANDINKIAKVIENALEFHNLRLIMTPIIVEGEEQRNISGTLMKASVSIARADIKEHLNDVLSPLLEFKREHCPGGLPSRPEIQVNYKCTRATTKSSGVRKLAPPKTEVTITLASCLTELDISIVDRISVILYQMPFNTEHLNLETELDSPVGSRKSQEPKTELKVECSNYELKVRFPKADLRPIHDPQRGPWWSRKIHQEFLKIHVYQLNAMYTLPTTLTIAANQFDVDFFESDSAPRIELARTSMRELPVTRGSTASVEYPKISIHMPTTRALQEVQERLEASNCDDSNDSDPNSSESIRFTQLRRDPTPFSSKRVLRESETRHTKESSNDSSDPESFVIPGDNTEMGDFCEKTFSHSRIQIELDLPTVSLQLGSKSIYEKIYNRLNSDLLMWQPSAPATAAGASNISQVLKDTVMTTKKAMETSLMNAGMMDSLYVPFSMCKSKINIGMFAFSLRLFQI